MKTLTTVFPILLAKLEVIRQVMEAYEITTDDELFSEHGHLIEDWTFKRGDVEMTVVFVADDRLIWIRLVEEGFDYDIGVSWESDHPEGDLWNISSSIAGQEWCGPILSKLRIQMQARGLFPRVETEDNRLNVAEPLAREAMDMIVGFFAKLPVDAPVEAATA